MPVEPVRNGLHAILRLGRRRVAASTFRAAGETDRVVCGAGTSGRDARVVDGDLDGSGAPLARQIWGVTPRARRQARMQSGGSLPVDQGAQRPFVADCPEPGAHAKVDRPTIAPAKRARRQAGWLTVPLRNAGMLMAEVSQ